MKAGAELRCDNLLCLTRGEARHEHFAWNGRTTRAGKAGRAVTFIGEWEFEDWDRIVDRVGAAALHHCSHVAAG